MIALDPARFEGEINGRAVGLFVLRSPRMQAAWCNHGARLLQLAVPDRDGRWRDVVLGHDSLLQLVSGMPSIGAFVGRFANRIAPSRVTIDGQVHLLPPNDGPHCLHGGPGGSRHQVFQVRSHDDDALVMGWTFRHADDGFPGEVDLHLTHRIEERPEGAALVLHYTAAVRGAATPLSFTSHPFFNLDGDASARVLDHELQVDAGHYLPVDAQRIPRGVLAPVGGSAFDFRQWRRLHDALSQGDVPHAAGAAPGFDHAFVTRPPGSWLTETEAHAASRVMPLRRQARLRSTASGIAMELWSDSPCLQLYSGGALDGSGPRHAGKHGRIHGYSAGVCLEPQHALPDAPNHPGLGPWLWRPGQTLRGAIEYRFSVDGAPARPAI